MNPSDSVITVVTGVPRSGTSLLMQVLAAAGLPVLTDTLRPPDEGNPLGYLEYAPVKNLPTDASWLPSARGKAVKVIHALVPFLPPAETCRILLLQRAWPEVVASQHALLARLGRPAPALSDPALVELYEKQWSGLLRWLAERPQIPRLVVPHHELVHAPDLALPRLAAFLDDPALDWTAARAAIAPGLHRNRSA